jgi:virginiamycin B lyase
MRKSVLRLTTQVAGISAWLLVALAPALAQSADTVLSGRVSSDREGAMEGVVVSARQTGSTMTVSVISDTEGKYGFPVSRVQPGHYDLTTRAGATFSTEEHQSMSPRGNPP